MVKAALSARFAIDPFPNAGTKAGVSGLVERRGIGIATINARRGKEAALSDRIWRAFAVQLPKTATRSEGSELTFIGIAPGAWFALSQAKIGDIVSILKPELDDIASVTDQSSAYVILQFSGPTSRQSLSKISNIDYHSRAFKVGDAATTAFSHFRVTICRLHDNDSGDPSFEILVPRSYSMYFCDCFSAANIAS